jgi:hypothetical protein
MRSVVTCVLPVGHLGAHSTDSRKKPLSPRWVANQW